MRDLVGRGCWATIHSSREPLLSTVAALVKSLVLFWVWVWVRVHPSNRRRPTNSTPLAVPCRAVPCRARLVLANHHEESAAGIAATAAHHLRSPFLHSELSPRRPVIVVVVVRIILVDKSASEHCCQKIGRDDSRLLGRCPSHHRPRCGRLDLSGDRPGFVVETKATTTRNEYDGGRRWRWSFVGT
jgi:hypothetical protein